MKNCLESTFIAAAEEVGCGTSLSSDDVEQNFFFYYKN